MIERIIIDNYKSIRHAEIDLCPINILIGENGAGKSNFISFFELIKALYDQRLGNYMLSNNGISSQLYNGRKASAWMGGTIDYNNTHAFLFRLRPGIGEKAFIEKTGDYFNPNEDKGKSYENRNFTTWDKDVEESGISSASYCRAQYIRDLLQSFVVYHFHDTGKTSPMRQPCETGDDTALRCDASNLAAVLYRLQQTEEKIFALIEGTVRSVAPYFKRFNLKPGRINPNQIKLEWEEKDSDMYLDSHALSDGTLRFIALTALLLQKQLPETIIIDEPELGLHPAAITKLAAMIKKASLKTQIIIATQSVELINNFPIEDLIVVGREERQSTFHKYTAEELNIWLEEYSVGELWRKNIIGGRP